MEQGKKKEINKKKADIASAGKTAAQTHSRDEARKTASDAKAGKPKNGQAKTAEQLFRAHAKQLSFAADFLLLAALAVFAFYVNRDIVIKGLYMDDLYMWSCYGEQSLTEFVFPIGTSTRFRPVYWLAAYLQMMIVGNHVDWFVPFNIICNIFVAASLYYIGKKVAKNRILAFGAGLCYLASRFAYYQIGQALGLMETLALLLAIWILYLLYRYLNAPLSAERTAAELEEIGSGQTGSRSAQTGSQSAQLDLSQIVGEAEKPARIGLSFSLIRGVDWPFVLALILYFLLVFVHERFLSLVPLFYLVLICRLLRKERKWRSAYVRENLRLWIAPAAVLLVIVVIRWFCIGTAMPAGTGGTEVTDTFHLKEAIGFAWSQVLYLFGVNAGPEHLNGLNWEQTPPVIKAYTKVSVLALGVICAMYALVMLLDLWSKDKRDKKAFWGSFCNALLFVGFIALCIGCSSVTIRVEMRWVYVSYAAALLFGIYMIRVIADAYRRDAKEESEEEARLTGASQSASQKTAAQDEPLSGNEKKRAVKPAVAPRTEAAAGTEQAGTQQNGTQPDSTAARPLTADEKALLEREQRGNIFRRSTRTVSDQLMRPPVITSILVLVFAVYCAFSISANMFYRTYYPKLYFWPDQLRMNSLAEQTVDKYGTEGVFGKDIYILKNTYKMSQFYADTFFKPFDKAKKAEGTAVHFAESTADIPEEKIKSGNILVLEEVPEQNAYRDITKEVLEKDGT